MKPIELEANAYACPAPLVNEESITEGDAYVLRCLVDDRPRVPSEARARVCGLFPNVPKSALHRAADLYHTVYGTARGGACLALLQTMRLVNTDAARSVLVARLRDAPAWARESASICYALLHLGGESMPPDSRPTNVRTSEPARFGYRGQR
jgi:hypothetical protein